MENDVRKLQEKKTLVIALAVVLVVFAVLFVLLTRDIEPEEVDERTPEEILIDEQTEELRIEMEDFEPLTEEDIESQAQDLEDLFQMMR